MRNINRDALMIWDNGAVNPRALARELVRAIDECTVNGSDGARHDPAVMLIMDQLNELVGYTSADIIGCAEKLRAMVEEV